MMTPRRSPYVYVTWLTKLLAGEDQCAWKSWFKTHNSYDKLPSDFNLAKWTADHNAMLHARANELKSAGWHVYIEGQNAFNMKNKDGVTVAGKPDIVALYGNRCLVIDCKTGKERHSDKFQVLIYMLVLPHTHPACNSVTMEGEVCYSTGRVDIPAAELTEEFKQTFREKIALVAGRRELAKIPSHGECKWCDIGKQYCGERIEQEAEVIRTNIF